jgi:outer membrane protein
MNMKKLLFALAFAMMGMMNAHAQRFAYVDTDYILDKIPAYKESQKKLDDLVGTWNSEIESKMSEVKQMYSKYQAEEFLLTDEMKKKRQEDIIAKEKIANDLQKQRFGYEGDLFKKRQEMIQPIQEKVYNAVEKIATNLGYDFILDKTAGGSTLLYTNSKYDLSEQVLKAIQP